eukprot:1156571-Pelagomonas_calceolata.AAC.4
MKLAYLQTGRPGSRQCHVSSPFQCRLGDLEMAYMTNIPSSLAPATRTQSVEPPWFTPPTVPHLVSSNPYFPRPSCSLAHEGWDTLSSLKCDALIWDEKGWKGLQAGIPADRALKEGTYNVVSVHMPSSEKRHMGCANKAWFPAQSPAGWKYEGDLCQGDGTTGAVWVGIGQHVIKFWGIEQDLKIHRMMSH